MPLMLYRLGNVRKLYSFFSHPSCLNVIEKYWHFDFVEALVSF